MELLHIRVQQTKDSTRGLVMNHTPEKTEWVCEVLEDGYRPPEAKEHGKTRIDAKRYRVVPIKFGRFFLQYSKNGDKFAIALMETPPTDRAGRHGNVRVHKGNKIVDTEGCPLVGNRVDYDPTTGNFFIVGGSSTPAYLRLYALLAGVYDSVKGEFTEDVYWTIQEQFI